MSEKGNWDWLLEGFKYDLETQVKPRTVEYYVDHVKVFVRWAQNGGNIADPALLTKRHLQAFFHDLLATPVQVPKGNGARSVVTRTSRTRWHYYRGLRRFLGWAISEGYLTENPLDRLRLSAPPPPPIAPYKADHLLSMLHLLDEALKRGPTSRQRMLAARTKAILLLFLESGLRLSELASLNLQDVDLTSQRILVREGKMGKGRTVGFGSDTRKALWKYLSLRQEVGSRTDRLWVTEEGLPMAPRGIQALIRRLKEDAGLKGVSGAVHKLRHTFATTYLKHTRDMKGCRLLLGHSTLAMVERYTQFIDAEDALGAYGHQGPFRWLMDTAGRNSQAAGRC